MSKRYTVFGLSVFLALALAVPALGGPTNPVASISAGAKSIATKALKKAKAAQSTANTALSTANTANTTANTALTEAKKAQTSASGAQTTANGAKSTAESAKSTAEAAKAAAEAAEANANTRIQSSTEVFGTASASNTEANKFASASCASGDPVLGGGFSVGGEAEKVTVGSSEEQLYGGGWFVSANSISGMTPTWSITAIAMCGTK